MCSSQTIKYILTVIPYIQSNRVYIVNRKQYRNLTLTKKISDIRFISTDDCVNV